MTRLCIYVEGPSEERFCNTLLIPHLSSFSVYPFAVLCRGKRGGHAHNYDTLWPDITKLIKEDRGRYVTTMLDLYGLPKNFPGMPGTPGAAETLPADYRTRAQILEAAFFQDIANRVGGDHARRFIPYLVCHEYEALLFSDVEIINTVLLEADNLEKLQAIRREFESPEAINHDAPPGKRLSALYPRYNKPNDGELIATMIGLPTIRQQCAVFDGWIGKLEWVGHSNAVSVPWPGK